MEKMFLNCAQNALRFSQSFSVSILTSIMNYLKFSISNTKKISFRKLFLQKKKFLVFLASEFNIKNNISNVRHEPMRITLVYENGHKLINY